MWGWLFIVFLFFAANENLRINQRAMGAYVVFWITMFAFLNITIVLHLKPILGSCSIVEEMLDWVDVSLLFGVATWLFELFYLMRVGSLQDYHKYVAILKDEEWKLNKAGLRKHYAKDLQLTDLEKLTSSEVSNRLSLLEHSGLEGRWKEAQPCKMRINSRALMRFGILYFLVDAVWGVYGLVLTANALGSECASNVPRLTTLMSLLSIAFGVGGIILSCTFAFTWMRSNTTFITPKQA